MTRLHAFEHDASHCEEILGQRSPELGRDVSQRDNAAKMLCDLNDERVLAAEMPEERRFVHTGNLRDLARRRAALALPRDHLAGGGQDALARLLG